jgi:threonylcarbamoyladenosine tRNA methylthiotransferase MtaB
VPTFYVENFGCRATQADGAALERQFAERGLVRAHETTNADVVVLNTCTVTAEADRDARAAIRRVKRKNPGARIVVTGCYAQRAPEEVAALPGVSCVVGNSHKHRLAEIALPSLGDFDGSSIVGRDSTMGVSTGAGFVPLTALSAGSRKPEAGSPIFISDVFAHNELLAAPVFDAPNQRIRPNLKVQDGCDNRCSFCVIPYVRGRNRSLALKQILEEVNALVASGYREVVVSGINLGRWGRDLGFRLAATGFGSMSQSSSHFSQKQREVGHPKAKAEARSLSGLIRAILDHTGLERLRISSVEPMDWSDELIELIASSRRVAKHAHVPMQSGSDDVLRRMHRKYRPRHYREKIEKIHEAMPTAAIGADVMVGFPGETDAEFEATRRMVEDLPFTYLHVFTYSPRPGTPAAQMPKQVPARAAQERSRVLRELAAEKNHAFMQSFVGKTLEVITLGSELGGNHGDPTESVPTPPSFTSALSDNYLKLRLRGRHAPNRWLAAEISDVKDGALVGSACRSAGSSPSLRLDSE